MLDIQNDVISVRGEVSRGAHSLWACLLNIDDDSREAIALQHAMKRQQICEEVKCEIELPRTKEKERRGRANRINPQMCNNDGNDVGSGLDGSILVDFVTEGRHSHLNQHTKNGMLRTGDEFHSMPSTNSSCISM